MEKFETLHFGVYPAQFSPKILHDLRYFLSFCLQRRIQIARYDGIKNKGQIKIFFLVCMYVCFHFVKKKKRRRRNSLCIANENYQRKYSNFCFHLFVIIAINNIASPISIVEAWKRTDHPSLVDWHCWRLFFSVSISFDALLSSWSTSASSFSSFSSNLMFPNWWRRYPRDQDT